jgi:pilus assembly protein Flp/PilA
MMSMRNFLMRAAKDQSGATAMEYGLIAALVATVLVGALTALGGQLQASFNLVAGLFP